MDSIRLGKQLCHVHSTRDFAEAPKRMIERNGCRVSEFRFPGSASLRIGRRVLPADRRSSPGRPERFTAGRERSPGSAGTAAAFGRPLPENRRALRIDRRELPIVRRSSRSFRSPLRVAGRGFPSARNASGRPGILFGRPEGVFAPTGERFGRGGDNSGKMRRATARPLRRYRSPRCCAGRSVRVAICG